MSNQIFSNAEVAELLNLQPNSLNKKRARLTEAEQLTEGLDWIKQDGNILWTDSGLAVLQKGQAIVPSEGQPMTREGDTPLPTGDLPTPSEVAAQHAPAVMEKYLAAVDRELATEVTRQLSDGGLLKKHLSSRWGVAL